jgi:large subunit ribosomal protein L22
MDAIAKAKFLRGSPQKARLVIDMIRGKNVAHALAILQFTNKRATDNIEKCLRSAIANATFKAEQDNVAIDPDDLWVKTCFVDMGPHKHRRRVRPAPQGRAYREQRYYCHITIEVTSEKPEKAKGGKPRVAVAAKPKTSQPKAEKAAAPVAEEVKTAPVVEETPIQAVEQENVITVPQAEAVPAETPVETETAATQDTPATNETEATAEEKKTE